jgi:glutathione peroxidase-family protein
LNKVKERKGIIVGSRTGKGTRYIYPFANSWKIRKSVNGVQKDYGLYDDLDTAIKIRDYLENIGWDYNKWLQDKKEIVEDITG